MKIIKTKKLKKNLMETCKVSFIRENDENSSSPTVGGKVKNAQDCM